jgi:hypothetical protein
MGRVRRVLGADGSGAQKSGRHHGDAVGPAVGRGSGGDDHRVEKVGTELRGQPAQMRDIAVGDGGPQLHFDSEDSAVIAFDDEVDLVVAVAGPKVGDGCIGGLRVDTDAESNKGLEELSEERAVARLPRADSLTREQRAFVDAEKPGSQRRVGEMMLGAL